MLSGKEISLGPGGVVDFPKETLHRIENPVDENLIFIEVKTGKYFGEEDVERLEDDYGQIDAVYS